MTDQKYEGAITEQDMAQIRSAQARYAAHVLAVMERADADRFGGHARACPHCGEPLTYDEGDPGDPPTWECPMGGAPYAPPAWACDHCGYVEIDHESKQHRR